MLLWLTTWPLHGRAMLFKVLMPPVFDKLLIMLGYFHIDLAFYSAVGTYINGSGIEFILTEANISAEGSRTCFIKGKFIIVAQGSVSCLLLNRSCKRCSFNNCLLKSKIPPNCSWLTFPSILDRCHLSDNTLTQHIDLHEDFLDKTINGSHGPNSQFWENYIDSLICLLRTVQRNVKTNGVNGYISIFPALLDVFFWLEST